MTCRANAASHPGRQSPDRANIQEQNPMKFRPLHDRVVVRRLNAEEKTAGGIIIPDTVQEKPMEGEIVAAGPGARNEAGQLVPLEVKDGDRILFGKWSGTEVKIDGQELLIMKESDIMGILTGPAAAGTIGRKKAA
jgi:chaperonin GroES